MTGVTSVIMLARTGRYHSPKLARINRVTNFNGACNGDQILRPVRVLADVLFLLLYSECFSDATVSGNNTFQALKADLLGSVLQTSFTFLVMSEYTIVCAPKTYVSSWTAAHCHWQGPSCMTPVISITCPGKSTVRPICIT